MNYGNYTCGNCGGMVDKTAPVCPHCGAYLSGIKCQKCGFVGSRTDFLADRCPKCRARVTLKGKPPLWVQIAVWLFLLALLAVVGLQLMRAQTPIINRGKSVPDFTLTLFSGYDYQGKSQVKLSDLHGKVVLINFWASWCKPCEGEAADLQSAWEHYQPGGEVVFLGVDYVDTEPEARSYLTKFSIDFPNGPDLGTRISQLFNRDMGVPETFIIDQEGILRTIKIGPFLSEAEIIAAVDPLLVEE